MKRSEMLRVIQLELHKRIGTHNINILKVAETILNKIEQYGMMPPEAADFNLGNKWEPEDE